MQLLKSTIQLDKDIEIDKDLISLIGIGKRIQSKSSKENLLNGNSADILACFHITGKDMEKN